MSGAPVRLLAIDTAGARAGLVVAGDGVASTAALGGDGRARTEDLAVEASRLLAGRGWTVRDLTLLGAVTGPGSYTGLRSGLAFLRGLALPAGLPVVGVGALELLAEATALPGERVATLWPLGGGRFAAAAWQRDGDGVLEVSGAGVPGGAAVDADGLAALLASTRATSLVLPAAGEGEDGTAADEGLAGAGLPVRRAAPDLLAVLADVVERKARRGLATRADDVLPVYAGPTLAKPNRARVAVAAPSE